MLSKHRFLLTFSCLLLLLSEERAVAATTIAPTTLNLPYSSHSNPVDRNNINTEASIAVGDEVISATTISFGGRAGGSMVVKEVEVGNSKEPSEKRYPQTRSIESVNKTVSPSVKCPVECSCRRTGRGNELETADQLEVLCLRGDLRRIPVDHMDKSTTAIIIRGPRNHIQLAATLQPLQKLQVLRVTESNVPTIGRNTFWGVQTLQLLDLSRNNITNLSEDNFRGQDNLLDLDLSRNKLTQLPVATFRHLRALRSLSLANNLIEELVQRIFFQLVRLRYLDLSYNPFQDLSPDIFKDVQELAVLKCRQCRLENLNPMFYHLLQFLVSLDLGENRIKYLTKDEFRDLKRLRVLRLDGNLLSVVVDHLFAAQHNLVSLDVSRNRLAKVANRAFASLGNCTHLDLSYNKLAHLSWESMAPLKQLRVLNISGNSQLDLTEIKPAFQQVPEITTLSVADMGPPLPMGLLLPLTHLKSLNLSGNHMDNVSLFILTPISTLQDLDLSHNQISGIEESIASRLLNIANVRLDNNPLICDKCHLGPLIGKVKLLNWNLPPICFFPDEMRGTAVNELAEQDIDNCVEIIENEDLDAASTSYNFLEAGNLSLFAVGIGVAAGTLLVLLIVFTLVLTRREQRRCQNNNSHHILGQLTNTAATTMTTRSDMEVGGGESEKNGHELMLPQNEKAHGDQFYRISRNNNNKEGRDASFSTTTIAMDGASADASAGTPPSGINRPTKKLKEVSFVFPLEVSNGSPSPAPTAIPLISAHPYSAPPSHPHPLSIVANNEVVVGSEFSSYSVSPFAGAAPPSATQFGLMMMPLSQFSPSPQRLPNSTQMMMASGGGGAGSGVDGGYCGLVPSVAAAAQGTVLFMDTNRISPVRKEELFPQHVSTEDRQQEVAEDFQL